MDVFHFSSNSCTVFNLSSVSIWSWKVGSRVGVVESLVDNLKRDDSSSYVKDVSSSYQRNINYSLVQFLHVCIRHSSL